MISIKRNEHLTSHVFDGHLNDMIEDYNRIVMVNLVKKNKPDEYKLTQSLI